MSDVVEPLAPKTKSAVHEWHYCLNTLGGTTSAGENRAANFYAYGSDHHNAMLKALNDKAGTNGLGLDAVCNRLANTTGLSALNALNQLV